MLKIKFKPDVGRKHIIRRRKIKLDFNHKTMPTIPGVVSRRSSVCACSGTSMKLPVKLVMGLILGPGTQCVVVKVAAHRPNDCNVKTYFYENLCINI